MTKYGTNSKTSVDSTVQSVHDQKANSATQMGTNQIALTCDYDDLVEHVRTLISTWVMAFGFLCDPEKNHRQNWNDLFDIAKRHSMALKVAGKTVEKEGVWARLLGYSAAMLSLTAADNWRKNGWVPKHSASYKERVKAIAKRLGNTDLIQAHTLADVAGRESCLWLTKAANNHYGNNINQFQDSLFTAITAQLEGLRDHKKNTDAVTYAGLISWCAPHQRLLRKMQEVCLVIKSEQDFKLSPTEAELIDKFLDAINICKDKIDNKLPKDHTHSNFEQKIIRYAQNGAIRVDSGKGLATKVNRAYAPMLKKSNVAEKIPFILRAGVDQLGTIVTMNGNLLEGFVKSAPQAKGAKLSDVIKTLPLHVANVETPRELDACLEFLYSFFAPYNADKDVALSSYIFTFTADQGESKSELTNVIEQTKLTPENRLPINHLVIGEYNQKNIANVADDVLKDEDVANWQIPPANNDEWQPNSAAEEWTNVGNLYKGLTLAQMQQYENWGNAPFTSKAAVAQYIHARRRTYVTIGWDFEIKLNAAIKQTLWVRYNIARFRTEILMPLLRALSDDKKSLIMSKKRWGKVAHILTIIGTAVGLSGAWFDFFFNVDNFNSESKDTGLIGLSVVSTNTRFMSNALLGLMTDNEVYNVDISEIWLNEMTTSIELLEQQMDTIIGGLEKIKGLAE